MPEPRRCAIYARFSTDRQSESSAEDQVRDCRARADAEGWTVVEVYSDLALSGASNRRPGLNALLADAASGAFDVVLSEALDRVSRNQSDIALIYQRLTFAGVALETLSEGPVNELHIGLKGTMSALFLKDLADKIRRGQRGSLARGRIPGGLCYGYDVVRELRPDGTVDGGRRRINPEQAAVVRRVLRDYTNGRSPRAIAHELNAEGIPSARGGEWRPSAIVGNRARQIGLLHNPIYVGRYVYNRVRMLRDPESRRRVSRPNPADEHQSIELPELRIVDDELWQRVQDVRQSRSCGPLVGRRRPSHLFSGLVRCGVCGGAYAVVTRDRLGCTRAREAGSCANDHRLSLAELQRRVLGGLTEQLLSPDAVSLLVREYHLERTRQSAELAKLRKSAERRLQKADAAVVRLVDAIASGGAEFADVRDALAQRSAERDAARAVLAEEDAVPVIVLHPHIAAAYRDRVRSLTEGLDAGTPPTDAIRDLIRSLVDSVAIHPVDTGVEIEIIGSLESAVALANGARPPKKGTPLTAMGVAEEGLEPPTRGL